MRLFHVAAVAFRLLILSFLTWPAAAADGVENSNATIVPVERWSSLFGGQEVSLHFRMKDHNGGQADDGHFQWLYSANDRTLARGDIKLRRDDAGQAGIKLRIPAVRDGVIFRTDLTIGYVPRGEKTAVATLNRTLWLFPDDPFVDQRETLKQRNFSLFDPAGRTARLFEEIEFPHQRIRNAAALDVLSQHSFVIIGEGTSLLRNRGLAERLIDFAATGGTVLMLAPSEGTLPLPDPDNHPRPGELRFRRHDVIREFDKRLDSKFLPGTNDFAGSKVSFQARRSRIGLEISEAGDWPWFTIEYPETNGRFVYCGFSLIQHWDNGPTPRFLLDRILTPRADRSHPSRD